MRIRMLLRLLCGLCFLVASSGASADYYQWVGAGSTKFDDPQSACESRLSNLTWVPTAESASTQFVMSTPPANGRCYYYRNGSFYSSNPMTGILVAGCPAGQIEDPETKECHPPQNPPPDDCATRGPGIFSKSGPVISSGGTNFVAVTGGGSACYGQCSHELKSSASSCYSSGDGTGFCNYIGTPTGGTCSESDAPLGRTGDPLNPPDTPDVPPSDPNDPGCPDGYGWSGTTCAKLPGDDGDTGGGDSGGGDTGGDTGGGGSGGGNSGGGDSGGGGDTGGGNSGGGDSGGGDSGGDNGGTGPGGGSGGGSGGDGYDGEDEEPTSSVGGESCDATLSCEGDAVQCAILRKQKEQVCMWRYGSLEKAQVEATLSGPDYELQEETLPVSGLFMEAVNKGRWLPQSCPSPERFTVMGRQFEMSYELICRFATALGPLLVIMASIFFAVYVGRAFKG